MKTDKLGGGVLNSAKSIKRIPEVLKLPRQEKSLVIVSAFGKTTDQLEQIAKLFHRGENHKNLEGLINKLYDFHCDIARELFPKDHIVFEEISKTFQDLRAVGYALKDIVKHDFLRDRIVSFGEILSSGIVSNYLELVGIENMLVYAYEMISTDANFGEAGLKKMETFSNIQRKIPETFHFTDLIITQGFIASTTINELSVPSLSVTNCITTLGREGSDYSGGIFAAALNVPELVLWKDVDGIMDMDPHIPGGENAKLIESITFDRCEELSKKGTAKGVIHPKTLEILKGKESTILVKNFFAPSGPGTTIVN